MQLFFHFYECKNIYKIFFCFCVFVRIIYMFVWIMESVVFVCLWSTFTQLWLLDECKQCHINQLSMLELLNQLRSYTETEIKQLSYKWEVKMSTNLGLSQGNDKCFQDLSYKCRILRALVNIARYKNQLYFV